MTKGAQSKQQTSRCISFHRSYLQLPLLKYRTLQVREHCSFSHFEQEMPPLPCSREDKFRALVLQMREHHSLSHFKQEMPPLPCSREDNFDALAIYSKGSEMYAVLVQQSGRVVDEALAANRDGRCHLDFGAVRIVVHAKVYFTTNRRPSEDLLTRAFPDRGF